MPQHIKTFARTTTARLALSYLAIIMVMSIGFSIVFYNTSVKELGRQVPPRGTIFHISAESQLTITDYIEERIAESRRRLLANLVLLNMLTLVAGGYISYILARKTLEPIENALQAQSRFASDASHELRTPLATIQAENEVVLRKKHLTLERAKEAIASNVEEIQRLRDITDGLLKLAREEYLELAPLYASDAMQAAIDGVQKQAESKHIRIDQAIHAETVYGDQQSLAQLFSILLDNAIKYSPHNSTVYVNSHTSDNVLFISIRDEGQGMSAEELPHIFERFYRADTARSSQHVGGFGLGLSIAEKIAEQHNGAITVESTPGKGSTFTVELPLVP